MADFLNGGARSGTHIFDGGARSRSDICDGLVGSFAHQISSPGPDIFDRGACSRTDVGDRLISTLTNQIAGARPDILHGRVETIAHKFASARADILDRRVDPFAYQLTGAFTDIFYGGACAAADVFDSGAHAVDKLLYDLRVAVYGREDPVYDSGHVVEPDLEERLRLHARYDELHPAEIQVDPDR